MTALMLAVALAGLAGCGRPGSSAPRVTGVSINGSFPPAGVTQPVTASDGSLWNWRGSDGGTTLIRISPDHQARTVSVGTVPAGALPDQASSLARSAAGTVWFLTGWDQVSNLGVTTGCLMGRVGPQGVVQRVACGEFDREMVGATDGALWMAGGSSGGQPALARADVDGSQRSFPLPAASGERLQLGSLKAGRDRTAWAVVENVSSLSRPSGIEVVHVGPSGVLSVTQVPLSKDVAVPLKILPHADGSLGVAGANQQDACLTGLIDPSGRLSLDQQHPLVNDHRYASGGESDFPLGCLTTAAGADGSLWAFEQPTYQSHGGIAFPDPPWYVFLVRPDGRRDRLTLPSHDFVVSMAPAPHDAMWFVTGKNHQLGVIEANDTIVEGLGDVGRSMASSPPLPLLSLVPTGGTTLYLVPFDGRPVRAVAVPTI